MFFISLRGRKKMPAFAVKLCACVGQWWRYRSSLRAQIVIVFHLNQTCMFPHSSFIHSIVARLTEFFTETNAHSQQQVFSNFQMSQGPPSLLWRKVDRQRAQAPSPRVHLPCHLSWLAPTMTDLRGESDLWRPGLTNSSGTQADWAHLGRCLLGIRKKCLPVFCLLYILPITHC